MSVLQADDTRQGWSWTGQDSLRSVLQGPLHHRATLVSVMDSIDNYYLPLTSTKTVVIAFFILEGDESEEQVEQMVNIIFKAFYRCGYHQDAIKFGFEFTDSNLVVYKKVPIFDVFGHLHSC
jgi:hypothetical protein